jgi:ribose 5-phosphate isomerase B
MIAIASDHGGFDLKNYVVKYLSDNGVEFEDLGTFNTDSVDYPDYAVKVAEGVAQGKYEKGIVICGTGIGISIAANKIHGIRAALCTDSYMARMSREHNDANILALGGRVIGPELALDIVQTWLNTDFLGGKHKRRIDKIADIEKK